MELPLTCACGREAMIDLERMEARPVTSVISVEGYTCQHCGKWRPVFATTVSLRDAMQRLDRLAPEHRSFRYRFVKTMIKARGIQEKVNYG